MAGRPPRTERRLAAILTADIAGYSAMMGRAEEETHHRVGGEIGRMRHYVERSHGRVFNVAGDGLLAEFPSAVEAVKCALRFQADGRRRRADVPAEHRLAFRIGIHAGEIIVQKGRIGGTAVNIAARLEPLAEVGGILISAAVYDQVRQSVPSTFEPLGERRLKNIRDPVGLYAVHAETCSSWVDPPALPKAAREPGSGRSDQRPSLAVLPFRTMSKGQSDSYFAECMIDDIIRALGGLKDLLVISRSSTAGYARAPLDLRRTFHELDADYVLHGSLRREGRALRVSVELASRDNVIWADRFDGAVENLFDFQDRIAIQVSSIVAPHLRARELARAGLKSPGDLTAYDLTLQALSLLDSMERDALARARVLLERACASGTGYAPAHSHLASLGMRWIAQGWSEDEGADQDMAARAAQAAVERDPSDALGLAISGHLQSYMFRNFAAAHDCFKLALAANPSCASAWAYSGLTLGYTDQTALAVQHAEQALRLSPLGSDVFWLEHYLSQAYYLAGRHDEAIAWGRMSAAKVPDNASNLRCLVAGLIAAGEQAQAEEVAGRLLSLMPGFRIGRFRSRTPLSGEAGDLFSRRLRDAGLPE